MSRKLPIGVSDFKEASVGWVGVQRKPTIQMR